MLVLTHVSSRKTKRLGSMASRQASNASRRSAMSGRRCSAGSRVFFERDFQGAGGAPEGGDADVEAESLAEGFEGVAGIVGQGPADLGIVALVEGALLDSRGAGRDLASEFVPPDESPSPLGGNGVLATEFGEGQPGLVIVKNSLAEVTGVRSHTRLLRTTETEYDPSPQKAQGRFGKCSSRCT
jgi:hypothetical protein